MTLGAFALAVDRMRDAIELARTTNAKDVPVGAIIYGPDGTIVGQGTNAREATQDPTAHAEIIAIRDACRIFGDGWRLTGCTMVVTLEPCAMCAGAIVNARLSSLVFGAYEPKMGAVGSLFDVVNDPGVTHRVDVRGGILERPCAQLMTDFFASKR